MKKGENVQKIDLICKVQQGDVQAQGQWYEQYWEKLYRLAYAITKNKEDSMDIVQDSFISAFAHINNLQDLIFLFVRSLALGGEYDTLSLTTSKDLPHLRMLDIDTDSLENLDMLYHTPALEYFQIGESDRVDDGISTIATLQQLRYLSIGGGGYNLGPLANCASLEVIAVMNNNFENMPAHVKLIDTKQGFEPIGNIQNENGGGDWFCIYVS